MKLNDIIREDDEDDAEEDVDSAQDIEDDEEKTRAQMAKLKPLFIKAWKASYQRRELINAYHSDIYYDFEVDDMENEDNPNEYHVWTGIQPGVKGAAKMKGREDEEGIDIDIDFTFENGVVEITGWHEAT